MNSHSYCLGILIKIKNFISHILQLTYSVVCTDLNASLNIRSSEEPQKFYLFLISLTHNPLQLPSVANAPCQQRALSHQVQIALLLIFIPFLITSCTSGYSASSILSINHFTVTCAKLNLAIYLPLCHQQTKMH